MNYTALTDLQKRLKRFYVQLYTDPETNEVDATTAEQDLTDAEAEVDSAVATRYDVPVTAAAAVAILKSWTLTLAEELAWGHSAQGKAPETVTARVEAVREQLKELVKGDRALPTAGESANSAGGAAFTQNEEPVFTRETMEGF